MKSPAQLSLRSGRAAAVALLACACLAGRGTGARAAEAPDRAQAALLLDHFRDSIWAEPIYAEFDLRQMPRRGDEHVFHGRFWGGRNARGPVTRFELDVGKGGFTHRLLVQGGPDGAVWTCDGAGAVVPGDDAVLAPLVPGVEMTAFDILPMPYLYWLDAAPAGAARIRGRQAFVFVFTPPADFAARHPAVRSVRAYLDGQYDALVQSEATGTDGHVSKTLSLLELRKVGERWIPKDVDVRNEATRDKTRLSLTAVAIGVAAAPAGLDPDRLGSPLAPPPAARVMRVAP